MFRWPSPYTVVGDSTRVRDPSGIVLRYVGVAADGRDGAPAADLRDRQNPTFLRCHRMTSGNTNEERWVNESEATDFLRRASQFDAGDGVKLRNSEDIQCM